MSKFYIVILYFLFSFNVYAIIFSEKHLPLSGEIDKTFPKLNARSFVIASKKVGVILIEKFSKIPMKFEGVNYFIFSSILLQILDKRRQKEIANYLKTGDEALLKNILREDNFYDLLNENVRQYGARNTRINLDNGETNLCDICHMFCEAFDFLEEYDCSGVLKDLFEAKSLPFCIGNNYGCAIKIKNAFGEDFYCVLYGAASFKDLKKDIIVIKTWLDQFFIYKIATAGEKIAEIPVFYGKEDNCSAVLNEDHYVLLSKNFDKTIAKTFVYRTMLEAPISLSEEIGVATYKTAIFKNSVTKTILAKESVERANRFKVVLDSFSYIIFGAPYEKTKIRKIEDF